MSAGRRAPRCVWLDCADGAAIAAAGSTGAFAKRGRARVTVTRS